MRCFLIYALSLCLLSPSETEAQGLPNPSFEGPSGAALTPPGWSAYGIGSSPDTQPGAWNVSMSASDGNTYLSLVCRGITGINDNMWEQCAAALSTPLKAGNTYHYTIDLAHSSEFFSGGIVFDKPVNLRIWGLNRSAAEEELLWQSGPVTDHHWRTYHMRLTPRKQVDELLLEAWYTQLPKYNGNILIDHFVYIPPLKQEEEKDTQTKYHFVFNTNHLPEQLNGREVSEQRTMHFVSNYLVLKVWDNRTFDGDTISLFLNDRCLLDHFLLSKEKKVIQLRLAPGSINYLTLFAHNLGKIPPNTAALIINDDGREKYVSLKSDLNHCGALKMIIGEETKQETTGSVTD